MKRVMYLVFVVCCGLGSMSVSRGPQSKQVGEGEYQVFGKIDGDYSGKVYLSEVQGGELVMLDSADVKNKQFSFQGKAGEGAKLVVLQDNAKRFNFPFFLEEGRIKLSLPAHNFSWGGKVSGTINNQVLSKFKLDTQYVVDSILQEAGIENILEPGKKTDPQAYERRTQLIADRNITVAKQLVKRFPRLTVSAFLIERYLVPSIAPEEVEKIVNSLDPVLADNPFVVKVKQELRTKLLKAGDDALEFPQMEGKAIKLADYRGKYLLLDFWASWCGPCMREMPEMVKLYKACKGKRFEMLGISLDQKEEECMAAVKKMGMKWRQICDASACNGKFSQLYDVKSIPYTVVIDPEGKIVAMGLRGKELEAKIRELVLKGGR